MRPHGNADISARHPRALGVCDRCGFLYNLDRLQWQWDWLQGPRLFNKRILVCPTCLDVPQESGRTIVLPPDPIPVSNARPELYALADNPASYLGFNPMNRFVVPTSSLQINIGNMTLNAGIDAAFDANLNKRAEFCAALSVSNSSFNNWVGKNWGLDLSGTTITLPSTVATLTHTVSSFTITAPNDQAFLRSGATGYHLDGSLDGVNWTTLFSGTTAGAVGESITATTTTGAAFPYHRVAIQGDGISAVALAQAQLNVSDQAPNDI